MDTQGLYDSCNRCHTWSALSIGTELHWHCFGYSASLAWPRNGRGRCRRELHRSATANCMGPACSSILLCSLQDRAQESDSARTHSLGTQDLLLRLPENLLPYYMGVTGLMQADERSRPGCERANPRPRRRLVRYSKLPTHGSHGSCVAYPTCRGSHCCRSTAKVRRNEVAADVPVPEVLRDVPIQAGGLFSHDMLLLTA